MSFKNLIFFTWGLILASQITWTYQAHAVRCDVCSQEEAKQCSRCNVRYYCSKECQTKAWPKHKDQCKSWKPIASLSGGVVIKESTLPGAKRGLFANKDFRAGEPIAVYYGEVFTDHMAHLSESPHTYLMHDSRDPRYVVGDPHPPAAHLGAQIMNDPLVTQEDVNELLSFDCSRDDSDSLKKIARFSRKYLAGISSYPVNTTSRYASENFLYRASQAISAGTELFTFYGLDYWVMAPVRICQRKGLPQVRDKITRTVSQVVEEVYASKIKQGKAQYSDFFGNYLSQKGYDKNRAIDADPSISFIKLSTQAGEKNSHQAPSADNFLMSKRLSGLFMEFGRGQIAILDWDNFERMAEHIHLYETLNRLAEMPHSEFIDDTHFGSIHTLSKELLAQIIDFIIETKVVPISIIDVEKRTTIHLLAFAKSIGLEIQFEEDKSIKAKEAH